MLKIFVWFLFLNIFFHPVHAQVINLRSSNQGSEKEVTSVEVYKPSKLIAGAQTRFIIKADPQTYVSIIFSKENSGAAPFYGSNLRLGDVFDEIKDVVGEKGIIEIKLQIPEDESLIGKTVYFEVIAWKKEDFSDLSKAKIIEINGRETNSNALVIVKQPNGSFIPDLGPSVPGLGNVSGTMREIHGQAGEEIDYGDNAYYYNKPLMLRNLRSPDLDQTVK